MIYEVILITAIGFLLGLLLFIIQKLSYAWEEPRIKKIEILLPGTNCSLCGYASCKDYAKDILDNNKDFSLCLAGSRKTYLALGKELGLINDLPAIKSKKEKKEEKKADEKPK